MRILLVHPDKYRWATTIRAEYFKKNWKQDEVEVAYFRNLPDGDKYDVIHFLFGRGLSKPKDYILKYQFKTFTSLSSLRSLEGSYDKLSDLIDIYKNTVCCVANNPILADKLKKLIDQDNVTYIPNGVDEKLFDRKFIVGFVGDNTDGRDHKGYQLVKQACGELELELKIAHSGQAKDAQPFEAMPEFYRSIDCLVLASKSEGCNNPTLEALAMNKPVISTRVGIAEELEGVTLVDRDVGSIKKALRRLSGRIQILESYTWKNIARRYRELYDKYR